MRGNYNNYNNKYNNNYNNYNNYHSSRHRERESFHSYRPRSNHSYRPKLGGNQEMFKTPPRHRRYTGPNNYNNNHHNNNYVNNNGVMNRHHDEDTKSTPQPKCSSIEANPNLDQTQNEHQNEHQNQHRNEHQNANQSENKPENTTTLSNLDSTNESETKWDHLDLRDKNQENDTNKNANNSGHDNHKSQNQYFDDSSQDRDVDDDAYDGLETWGHGYRHKNNQRRERYNKYNNYNRYNHNHSRLRPNYFHQRSQHNRHYQRDIDRDRNERTRGGRGRFGGTRGRRRERGERTGRELRNSHGTKGVCKFYIPYFKSGCNNVDCEYSHLTQDEYIIYCRYIRKSREIDSYSRRRFDDGLSFIRAEKINQAFRIFSPLARKFEFDAHCNFWLGRCYAIFQIGTDQDREYAKYYLQKAISLLPENPSFHAYYAEFMVDFGRILRRKSDCYEFKQARKHILKALEMKPCARYTLQYAKLLDEIEGEFFEAKKHYQTALKTYGSDTRVRLNYARLLHKMGNYRAAKQEFSIIFEKLENSHHKYGAINPRWIWPHFHYAKLLVDMRYYKEAKQKFELCIEIMEARDKKYFGDIYYEFSKLLFKQNDNDQAYYFINKAVSIQPRRLYYKKLLYSIQDAYYKRNDASFKYPEKDDIDESNQRPGSSSGFRFSDDEYDKYKDYDQEEDDYGVPEDEDIAETKSQLSLSSCSGFHAMKKKPKLEVTFDQFVDGMNKENNNPKENENETENESENNNEVLEIPDNPDMPESPEMETRFCETEFDRFISTDNLFGSDELEQSFNDKFEDEGFNDIRWLLNDDALNDNLLKTKIKMDKRSIFLWKKRVNLFRKQYNDYIEWLKTNNFYDKYVKKFQVYGILNLEAFFYYIKNIEDVEYMIGPKNKMDAKVIWESAKNHHSKIMN